MGTTMCFYRRVKPDGYVPKMETYTTRTMVDPVTFEYELDQVSEWVRAGLRDWHKPPHGLFDGEWSGVSPIWTSRIHPYNDDEPFRRPEDPAEWLTAIRANPALADHLEVAEEMIRAFIGDPGLYYFLSH